MVQPRPGTRPAYVLVVQRNISTICYRRISNVVKEQALGSYGLLLVKAQHVYYLIEGRTGLYLGKGTKLAEVLPLFDKQNANKLRLKLEELPNLLNGLKRRVYECI